MIYIYKDIIKKYISLLTLHDLKNFAKKENIDYTAVYNAKIKALRKIFARLEKQKDSSYKKLFNMFKAEDDGDLQRLALFQAICEERCKQGGSLSASEEKELSSSLGTGIEKFALSHQKEIEFFKFLQSLQK